MEYMGTRRPCTQAQIGTSCEGDASVSGLVSTVSGGPSSLVFETLVATCVSEFRGPRF